MREAEKLFSDIGEYINDEGPSASICYRFSYPDKKPIFATPIPLLEALLKKGISINTFSGTTYFTRRGLLEFVLKSKKAALFPEETLTLARFLLEQGADVNASSSEGIESLFAYAIESNLPNKREIVELLLLYKPSFDILLEIGNVIYKLFYESSDAFIFAATLADKTVFPFSISKEPAENELREACTFITRLVEVGVPYYYTDQGEDEDAHFLGCPTLAIAKHFTAQHPSLYDQALHAIMEGERKRQGTTQLVTLINTYLLPDLSPLVAEYHLEMDPGFLRLYVHP